MIILVLKIKGHLPLGKTIKNNNKTAHAQYNVWSTYIVNKGVLSYLITFFRTEKVPVTDITLFCFILPHIDQPFTFQCTLHKDGTIWFAYKQVVIK